MGKKEQERNERIVTGLAATVLTSDNITAAGKWLVGICKAVGAKVSGKLGAKS